MKHFFTLSWLLIAAFGQVFGQCPPGQTELTMTIVTDRYGDETTWSVTGQGGSPAYASGGTYAQQTSNGEFPQTPVTFCVPDGAIMEISVNDSYGDGMCCAYGNGSWTLTMGSTTIASGGSFLFEQTAMVALGTDLGISSFGLDNTIAQGSTPITGTVTNNGINAVNSFTLSYSVDGGSPVTQNFNNSIAPGATYAYTFTTPWMASVGAHTVAVSVSGVTGDVIASNNELVSNISVATQSVARKTVVEEFTSSTCAPCASLNVTFDPLLSSLGANQPWSNVLAVKYQMNWPSPGNDPSYNADGNTRKTYYGVTGIPDVFMDGADPMGTTWGNAITNAAAKPAFCDVQLSHTVSGTTVDVQVTITPYADFSGTHKLYIAAVEDYYYYPASTTTQDHFYYALRKMMPSGNGITVTNLQAGVPQTFEESYTFTIGGPAQNNHNTWTSALNNITLISFVQNQSTKNILQGAMSEIVTNVNELGQDMDLAIYPNPTNGMLNINMDAATATSMNISITNVVGEVVMEQRSQLAAGQQTITLDMNALANGSYYVTLRNADLATTRKITLTR